MQHMTELNSRTLKYKIEPNKVEILKLLDKKHFHWDRNDNFKINKITICLFFSFYQGENKLVKSVNFLPANIKSMNSMQKFPHITELFACTWKMLAFMFLFPIKFLISSGTRSTAKLLK